MGKWLKCTIGKGMFSDEVTATIKFGGESLAVFVPRSYVEETPQPRVKVRAFVEGGKAFVVLPDESQTSVRVDPTDLQPA